MPAIIPIVTPELIDAFSKLNQTQVIGLCFIVGVLSVVSIVKIRWRREKKTF